MTVQGRDRLRELLDAALAEDAPTLDEMAQRAHSSAFHFSRVFARGTGEPPVSLRRRVLLERAAWQLAHGRTVTDAAFEAGYESVEGFARAYGRAYGHPPGRTPRRDAGLGPTGDDHWIDAPNGIHFHPPANLWIHDRSRRPAEGPVTAHLLHHDLDDTTELITLAAELDEAEYRRNRLPGSFLLRWDGPEESLADVLAHHVRAKECWLAAIAGEEMPEAGGDSPAELAVRHQVVGARWVATVADIARRDAWGDRLIDALCEPPESFVLTSVVAHVITYGAHRRQLARLLLRQAGMDVDHGDPIEWWRRT
ncbi:helix-turn-helix transcriptional regulator [Propionibacteriaceae bacterium Y2011]